MYLLCFPNSVVRVGHMYGSKYQIINLRNFWILGMCIHSCTQVLDLACKSVSLNFIYCLFVKVVYIINELVLNTYICIHNTEAKAKNCPGTLDSTFELV